MCRPTVESSNNDVRVLEAEENVVSLPDDDDNVEVIDSLETNATRNYDNPWRNPNVILQLIWCVMAGIAGSVWSNTVLAGFLLALAQAMQSSTSDHQQQYHHREDDNTLVGTAEAVQGIAMLLSALPVGLVADWFGKARVVAYGGIFVFLTIVITVVALVKAKHAVQNEQELVAKHATHAYYWMLVALAMWGVSQGILEGPSQALFADSISKGKRSALMTWQYTAYLLSSMVGPILGVVMILRRTSSTDDSWSLSEIYPVFMTGVLLEIPSIFIVFFFSEKYTVMENEENEDSSVAAPVRSNDAAASASLSDDLETPLLDNTEDASQQAPSSPNSPRWRRLGKASIPYVLFTASLVTALGSGASVKYFPLFFRELGFSSAFVQSIYILVPLSIALFAHGAQLTSRKFGRIETTVLFEVVGVCLLFYMTWLSHDEKDMTYSQKYRLVGVYLIRTGLMNAGYPLIESVMMDALPSNQRARWKSLESIAAFGWTGSALVGGIFADERSYRFTFAITASFQLVGALMLAPLQPFVESEVPPDERNNQEQGTLDPPLDEDDRGD